MRLFAHITAEYSCSKKCGNHLSVIGPKWSPFYVIVAFVAAVPWWLVLIRDPWDVPRYYLLNIFAGELLLFYPAEYFSSLARTIFLARPMNKCSKCGAPMFFAGRHFDPLGSKKPHWTDIVLFVLFIIENIIIWFCFMEMQQP